MSAASIARRIAGNLTNRLLISTLGLKVVSSRSVAVELSRSRAWFDRLLYFQRLLGLLETVEGDVVECGVARGDSLALLASLVRSGDRDRHVWGFDSWEGLPEPGDKDIAPTNPFSVKGMFRESDMETVLDALARFGFSQSETKERTTLVEGQFAETLPAYGGADIALLHIDADLYRPYRDCLENLWPRISVQGIAAFDEYHIPEWPGAKQAVDEFLDRLAPGSAKLQKDRVSGRYYLVKVA